MPSWWQEPYKGAPPPKDLPPLPRNLYPPSAKNKGKTPSKPGPDVKAMKRAVSRGGGGPGRSSMRSTRIASPWATRRAWSGTRGWRASSGR